MHPHDMHPHDEQTLRQIARRDFLGRTGMGLGLGAVAFGSLIEADGALAAPESSAAAGPLAPKPPHYAPRAKSVIQLFMAGGPSQLELFDYKPKLRQLHGQVVPQSYVEGKRFAFIKKNAKCLGTVRSFDRYGQCGLELSELLPHTAGIADDVALIKTMHTDNFNHGPAKLIAQTGTPLFGRPSLGSWVLYGLGSEAADLPGFVVLSSGPRGPRGGAYLWSSGFLSSALQGVPLRTAGDPILNLQSPKGISRRRQQRTLDAIAKLNAERLREFGDPEVATRIANYEMAFRMQTSAPELIDLSQETQRTLDMYGATPGRASFANNCLLARRMVERGVRVVTLFHTDWDHHGGGDNLEGSLDKICRQVDQPCAALVNDLKQRGMLDDTLVVWGGEFGRTPMGEVRNSIGRDHHIDAFTVWLAGGGVQGGQTLGETDELGFYPTQQSERYHMNDLQATILHLLGLDHLRLTYRFQGRDFRLTDVGGKIIQRLLA